jgi:hypothetical protein
MGFLKNMEELQDLAGDYARLLDEFKASLDKEYKHLPKAHREKIYKQKLEEFNKKYYAEKLHNSELEEATEQFLPDLTRNIFIGGFAAAGWGYYHSLSAGWTFESIGFTAFGALLFMLALFMRNRRVL